MAFAAHINYQPANTPIPAGYFADTGAVYGLRANGLTYGWNASNSSNARDRNTASDQRYDTLNHMQKPNLPNAKWEIAVPNGDYIVHIVCGDPTAADSIFRINAESKLVVSGTPTSANRWVEGTQTVTVSDGRLTISNGAGASNNKIDFIDIASTDPNPTPGPNPNLTWHKVKDAPSIRAEGARAVVNGKLYIVGGFLGTSLKVTTELDVYDPVTNEWTRLPDMPVAQTHAATAVDGNSFWILGFFKNDGVSASSLVYKYDTIVKQWTQGPNLPGARGAAGAAILGRELHVWGGLTGQTTSAATHWALNLDTVGAVWQTRKALPQRLDHMGSLAFNGKLWSIGGFIDKKENDGNQSVVYRYDPSTDDWATDVAQLPIGLGHIGPDTTVAGDKIVIAGGQINAANETMSTQVLQYDPAANKWTNLPSLPLPRKSAFVGFLNGKLIVSCGNQPNSPYESATTWLGY